MDLVTDILVTELVFGYGNLEFGYGLVTHPRIWLRFGYACIWLRFGYDLVTKWLRFGYGGPCFLLAQVGYVFLVTIVLNFGYALLGFWLRHFGYEPFFAPSACFGEAFYCLSDTLEAVMPGAHGALNCIRRLFSSTLCQGPPSPYLHQAV